MDRHMRERHDSGFMLGVLAGAVLGAGLTMFFAPKVRSEIRKRATDSAKDLGKTASEYYEHVSTRVGDAVDELASRAQKARDVAADAVARGAQRVGRGAREVDRLAATVATAVDSSQAVTAMTAGRLSCQDPCNCASATN